MAGNRSYVRDARPLLSPAHPAVWVNRGRPARVPHAQAGPRGRSRGSRAMRSWQVHRGQLRRPPQGMRRACEYAAARR